MPRSTPSQRGHKKRSPKPKDPKRSDKHRVVAAPATACPAPRPQGVQEPPAAAAKVAPGGNGILPLRPECVEVEGPAPVLSPAPAARRPARRSRERPARRSATCVWPAPRLTDLEGKVRELIAMQGSHPDEDLVEDLIMTALRTVRDGATRGELKMLAAAARELRYAFKIFRPFSGRRKISVFGSARAKREDPLYQAALAFSQEMVRRGFMVITGAGPGIMEAANGGAGRDYSFGVNIRLPFEQAANPHIDGDEKLISFRYFFTRKVCFVKEASGFALFPGGFGTHDESFETLTLIQTGKASIVPVVFIDNPGGTYWREWADYVSEHLLGKGLISEEDMNLFKVTDDIHWAADHLSQFYRRYHSSRWVKNQLVIRMASPLPEKALKELNREFRPILEGPDARIVGGSALPEEADQPELEQLPRLILPFNKRNFGQLRKLIDALNRA